MRVMMNSISVTVLLAMAISGCQSQQRSGGAGVQEGGQMAQKVSVSWSGSHTVEVKDPAAGENAFSIEIPAGWKFEGTILRPVGCHRPSTAADGLSFGVASPDGFTAMGQMPGVSWEWASDGQTPQKCPALDITTAAGFLLNIAVPNTHPQSQIIGVVPLPDNMKAGLEARQRQLASAGGPMRQMVDSARVKVEYVIRGQVVEEQMGTVLTCMENHFPAYPQMRRPARTIRQCETHGTYFKRAPKGYLDTLLANNTLKAPQIDQAWDTEISRKMQAQYDAYREASDHQFASIQEGFRKQTEQMLQHGRDVQATIADGTRRQMQNDRNTVDATSAMAHHQVLDSLNRAEFVDPTTVQRVQTSNQFSHNWISSDKSEVALNDDPTLDPNGVVDPVRQSWTELVPVW
jgi:hypothetical protein